MQIASCPFCSYMAVVERFEPKTGAHEYFIRCYGPKCRALGPARATEDAAIAAWNNWMDIARRILSVIEQTKADTGIET